MQGTANVAFTFAVDLGLRSLQCLTPLPSSAQAAEYFAVDRGCDGVRPMPGRDWLAGVRLWWAGSCRLACTHTHMNQCPHATFSAQATAFVAIALVAAVMATM